jgi:hypothetical protein
MNQLHGQNQKTLQNLQVKYGFHGGDDLGALYVPHKAHSKL